MNRIANNKYYRTPNDDYVYDEFGNLIRIDNNIRVDRIIIENSVTHKTKLYQFSDFRSDPRQIDRGIITGILFVSADRIIKMIASSGALDKINRSNAKDYLLQEGKGGGKLDFSYTSIPLEFSADGASNDPLVSPSPILFRIEGMIRVENHMNFGNFLFGAAGYALGSSALALSVGAHYNSLINSGENGYSRQLDSSDDQASIHAGVEFAIKHSLRYKEVNQGSSITAKTSPTPRKL